VGELEANVQAGGEVAVDAASLFQVVRALPEATVHLKLGDGNRLQVQSGRAEFKLLGVGAEEYPALPPFEAEATAALSAGELARLVEQVQFSIATEDVRWGINGAHVEEADVDGERRLRFVATDRHRLAVSEAPFEGETRFTPRMLVPRKALSVLRKLLEVADEQVQLDFGEGALQMRREDETFWFRLLDGEFPDYQAVLPSDHKHTAMVRRSDLASTLKRVSILVPDRARPVRFAFQEAELQVEVHNVDKGEVHESLPIELDGEPITVGFNARYLVDILGVLQGDRVCLQLAHPLAPCLVTDPEDGTARFVVMPMRLD
jgi:DNA polymerase-3 subunit beta